MPVIKIKQKGNFKKSESLFKSITRPISLPRLEYYGELGVSALYSATPYKTGKTARSWHYTIEQSRNKIAISWDNDNIARGIQVAILLQYGHATKSGSWVEGIDYINPALAPVFDKIENDIWKEVTDK